MTWTGIEPHSPGSWATIFTHYTNGYIYIYIYIYFIKHNRHFMSTYFLLDPFEFPYYFYCILGELIYVLSIVACIPSTFCPTLGHHQGRIYYILTECNLSLHEITSVFQSAVIFMSCRIMKFKICIFRQHFFVNANFIKHNRHFMSTYFLLDPFEFPESTRDTCNYGQYINQSNGSKRKYVDIKCLLCLMKFALTKKYCLNIHIYI